MSEPRAMAGEDRRDSGHYPTVSEGCINKPWRLSLTVGLTQR